MRTVLGTGTPDVVYFRHCPSPNLVVGCYIPWPFSPEIVPKRPFVAAYLKGGAVRISTENREKSQKVGRQQTLVDATLGLMADFLRLIDVNAGDLQLKKGPGNLTSNVW